MPVLLKATEAIINKVIAQDDRAMQRVAELTGKVVSIHVVDWQWRCLVAVGDQGLLIAPSANDSMPCDVAIAGKGVDLLTMIASRGDRGSLQGTEVTLTGSLSVAQAIQALLADLAIDWEGMLAPLMGNAMAHEVSKTAQASKRFLCKIASKLRQDTADVLHDEMGLAPNRMAVEDFYHQIELLRADTDRLWQRFQLRANGHKVS